MKKVLVFFKENLIRSDVHVDYGVFLIFFLITMLFVLTILNNI